MVGRGARLLAASPSTPAMTGRCVVEPRTRSGRGSRTRAFDDGALVRSRTRLSPFGATRSLRLLVVHDVDFVVIGGIAGIARGSDLHDASSTTRCDDRERPWRAAGSAELDAGCAVHRRRRLSGSTRSHSKTANSFAVQPRRGRRSRPMLGCAGSPVRRRSRRARRPRVPGLRVPRIARPGPSAIEATTDRPATMRCATRSARFPTRSGGG